MSDDGRTIRFDIDMDAPCRRCRKKGALPSGLCLACVARGIKRGDYDHIIKGRALKREEG